MASLTDTDVIRAVIDGVPAELPRLSVPLADGRRGWYQRNRLDCMRAAVATVLSLPYDDVPELLDPSSVDRWAVDAGYVVQRHYGGPPAASYIGVGPMGDEGLRHVVAVVDGVLFDPGSGWRFGPDRVPPDPVGELEHAITLEPEHERYGVLRAPQVPGTPTAVTARDDFTGTTAGNALNGRTAPLGGTWATSGAATDFVFADAVSDANGTYDEHLTRSASGTRYAILGSTDYTDVEVRVRHGGNHEAGVIGRWTDASNHLAGRVQTGGTLVIAVVLAGSETVLATKQLTANTRRLVLRAYATGNVILTAYPEAGVALGTIAATHAALKTGGVLEDGKPGLVDIGDGLFADRFDQFEVLVPTPLDATLYPNQAAELRTDGIYREGSAGGTYAPAPHVGALPRLPASGLEDRPVELYVSTSRGDFDQIPDTGLDDFTVQVFYRPCVLFVPDGTAGS